jgi:acetyl-CoA carboxylase biotin carboxyl carrier protein
MSERTSGAEDADAGKSAETGAAEASKTPAAPVSPETASLLSLVDRLGSLLEKSDLVEIEVEAGETAIILRKPSALAPGLGASASAALPGGAVDASGASALAPAAESAPTSTVKAIKAPLTGVYYASSSPNSPPFVTVGQKIEVGTVIGLIEAMKLFNEIKSDQAGRVSRMVAETGKLVKAKQTLIEVEPA